MAVTEITSPHGPLPHIPDDVTIPQFLLDSWHPVRPVKRHLTPWFIDDVTGRQVTYEEVRARVFGVANELKARWNLGENDTVCIFSPNHIDYPIVLWGVHRLGGIVTTANPSYTADELLYQLDLTGASVIFTHSGSLATTEKAAREAGILSSRIVLLDSPSGYTGPYTTLDTFIQEGLSKHPAFVERRLQPGEAKTKIALLNFSSGTTGRPKAVAIPHYAVIANTIQMSTHGQVHLDYAPPDKKRYRPGQVTLAVLPLYHIYGLVVTLHFHLFFGATLVMVSKFHFEDMLKSIQRYHVNHLLLVPPMIVLLCKSSLVKKYDLSSVEAIMSGAAPMSVELTRQFAQVFPNAHIGQGYGMTETCTTVSFPRLDQKIGTPGSGGQLLPGVTARVLRPDGTWAGYHEAGELVVKCPSVTLCYLNNEAATKETFIYFDGKPDRWVKTGDEVLFNEQAEIFVLDRLKEFLKVKGFQVAPAELEGLLLDHPDVDDACVVGVPDEYSGELPMAFIVPSPPAAGRIKKGSSEEANLKKALAKYVAEKKAHYKHLAGGVVFVDSIPKNPSGKLLRRFLRDKAKTLTARERLVEPARAKL